MLNVVTQNPLVITITALSDGVLCSKATASASARATALAIAPTA
jgi:hypothetical protein